MRFSPAQQSCRGPALTLLLAGVLLLALPGCDGGGGAADTSGDEAGAGAAGAVITAADGSTLSPADFVAAIDNRFIPLTPGTTYVYEGETEDGKEYNEVTVTNDKKEILGVSCTVVHDRVWLDGELIEETFDWYAQDRNGTVWYFGEDVDNYENGRLANHDGAWEAGKDGAKPGIIMKADPSVGESWWQEYLEGEAEDQGEIIDLGESITVKAGSYDGCIRTRDWTRLEPDIEENKVYCPLTGVVFEEMVKGGTDTMELTEIRRG